ncbi:hypothetical protein CSIRO_3052 [Bradyrhizobiaceae bacterium SG-6C]|nr:hypothetical protein CSIRO_3052 [Bradyrhizobiaceae bacterium SG-6C]
MEQWLAGFVAGGDSVGKFDVIGVEDYDTLVKWMDRYCAAHRSNLLKEGARELVLDLVRKNNKSR